MALVLPHPTRLVGAALGTGSALALVHRLHPRDGDLAALLEQLGPEPLLRWPELGTRVALPEPLAGALPRAVGTSALHDVVPAYREPPSLASSPPRDARRPP